MQFAQALVTLANALLHALSHSLHPTDALRADFATAGRRVGVSSKLSFIHRGVGHVSAGQPT